MGISLVEFSKAIDSLEEALNLFGRADRSPIEKKAFRDASLQRFKYCIELAWKVSMKVLGSTTAAAKPAVREMARNDLIKNPTVWLDYIEARNNTSHSYDEDLAQKVFVEIQEFLPQAKLLLGELQKIPQ